MCNNVYVHRSTLGMDTSAMDCSTPSSDEGGKLRLIPETRGTDDDDNSPGKVTSKTDSQSTEGFTFVCSQMELS